MRIKRGYSFDDVLLIPRKSNIESRSQIDVSTSLGRGIDLKIPIISANMKNVTGPEMAKTIAELGGLALLHRFETEEERYFSYLESVYLKDNGNLTPGRLTYDYINHIGMSFGVSDSEKEFFASMYRRLGEYLKIICIDVAHGHNENCLRMVDYVRNIAKDILIIAGNVSTSGGAKDLIDSGADVIKIGQGSGSLCSTRIETGNGVPQLSALIDVHEKYFNKAIISDGGTKNSGDLTKALCFSNAVMLGNLLAGSDQAPGNIIIVKGQEYKQYAGSSTHKLRNIEGVIGMVPYRGDVKNVIDRLIQGLQSGMSYQGVDNLTDLRKDREFVEISNAGIIESRPHDIIL